MHAYTHEYGSPSMYNAPFSRVDEALHDVWCQGTGKGTEANNTDAAAIPFWESPPSTLIPRASFHFFQYLLGPLQTSVQSVVTVSPSRFTLLYGKILISVDVGSFFLFISFALGNFPVTAQCHPTLAIPISRLLQQPLMVFRPSIDLKVATSLCYRCTV